MMQKYKSYQHDFRDLSKIHGRKPTVGMGHQQVNLLMSLPSIILGELTPRAREDNYYFVALYFVQRAMTTGKPIKSRPTSAIRLGHSCSAPRVKRCNSLVRHWFRSAVLGITKVYFFDQPSWSYLITKKKWF